MLHAFVVAAHYGPCLVNRQEVLEYQTHRTPGIVSGDTWSRHRTLYSTGSHWLHCSEGLKHAHTDIFCREDMTHSSEFMMHNIHWPFLPRAHVQIHIHKARQSSGLSPKVTAVCNWGDKEKAGKLGPAGEHSLRSTGEDKSKRKACLTELVGRPTKGHGGLIRGGEDLHRNSPEAEETFCSAVRCTSETNTTDVIFA